MSLPRFGVTNPVPVNLLMATLLAGGVYFGLSLRREFFPEISPDAATVNMPYPGATPEEIEESLARKVEDALADLDEVDTLRTTISEGGGGMTVEFREGTRDVTAATDEVERAVEALTDLPDEAERIQVRELEPRLPVAMVSVYGNIDEAVLKSTIRQVRDDLRSLPGMGELLASGVRDYEIRIDVSSDAVLEYGLSLPRITDVVRRWMADVPGGTVRSETGNISVRTLGVSERSEAIRQIVVAADAQGQALRLGDIATVTETFVDEQLITRFNGRPSASLTAIKVGDQDIVRMAKMTRAYVDGRMERPFTGGLRDRLPGSTRRQAYDLGRDATPLPKGIALAVHSDLARFVEGRLQLLIENAIYGAILVFGTLLLFLNWRVAFWVGVGLVTALSGTLILMYWTNITLNLLTMFGLIVVLGILVDDAIVVAENIQSRHDRGEASLVAAVRGTHQVFWPVVATVLTSIVAFLPLTFVKGRIGDLLGALPTVVAVALIMSLIESLLIMPSHMGHSLVHRDKHHSGHAGGIVWRYEAWRDGILLQRIVPAYAWLLNKALRYRYISFCAATAVLFISLGMLAGGRLEFVFLPSDDAETIVVDLRMPLGSSVERTSEVAARIERAARAQDEIRSISAVIGQASNMDTGLVEASATHLAQLFLELRPVELRERSSDEVIAAVRESAGSIDEADRISYREVSGGPGGADITIEMRGADMDALMKASAEIRDTLSRYPGVFDVFDDHTLGQRELQITLKPGAAPLGFTVSDVANQVRGALFGLDAHVFSDQQEDIDIRVRADEATRRSLYAVENLWIVGPDGRRVPLVEIAELQDGLSYATIRRVQRQRAITVTAETAPEVSPETVTADFGVNYLPMIQARYPGVAMEFTGRQKQMRDAFASLPLGFAAAMAMVYVILAWLFGSYTQPLAVMMAVPFAIVGVIWGHLLLGFHLTFLSLIG
ncbi:MAG: efflux RND transporter permease subunit, partial [Planctomycetota bacterium]